MTEVAIRRCALLIRRPAGAAAPWLEGEDHRALARKVQALVLPMLEELLAPRLAAGGTERRLPALRIDLALRADELAGAAPLARPGLRARLAAAVAAGAAGGEAGASDRGGTGVGERGPAAAHPDRGGDPGPGLPALLRQLARLLGPEGVSPALMVLPAQALAGLIGQVLDLVPDGADAAPDAAQREPVDAIPVPAAGTGQKAETRRRTALAAALAALVEAARDGRAAAGTPAGRRSLARIAAEARALARAAAPPTGAAGETHPGAATAPAPVARGKGARARAEPANSGRMPPAPAIRPPAPSVKTGRAGLALGRHPIDHALPFLALAVLARHGLVEAMALDAGTAEAAAILADAVGRQSLPGAEVDAARAAGLVSSPAAASRAEAAARIGAGALCRAGIAGALAGTLGAGPALPLVAAGARVVLFDPAGLYPVASGRPGTLAPFLARLGRRLCLAPAAAAAWQTLAGAGLPLMAEGAAPSGIDALPLAGPRGWRGHATAAAMPAAAGRAGLERAAAQARRAAEVWQALAGAGTPDAAPAPLDEIQDLAALLAGFALADIGWSLGRRDPASWRDTDPLLVRDRFGDLAGWLEVSARELAVILPLGRRAADLGAAGLLATVPALPWWPGRPLSFRGG